MNAAVVESPRALEVLAQLDVGFRHRLARVTGLLYVLLAVFGAFAPIVLETLVVPGDATATAGNVAESRWLFVGSLVSWLVIVVIDIALAVTFYVLLAPVSRVRSLAAAAFRLVYSAMLGALLVYLFDAYLLFTRPERTPGGDARQQEALALAAIDTFGTGFLVALVFFGVHLVVLGLLLYRSRYVPQVFSVLLVAAGVGYIADSLASLLVEDHGGLASAILLAPAVVGELGLAGWLVVKGVRGRER